MNKRIPHDCAILLTDILTHIINFLFFTLFSTIKSIKARTFRGHSHP